MSELDELRGGFFEECEDLLTVLAEGLQQLAEGDDDRETVNAVFRAVHSIKGGAGAFGLDVLVNFAHKFETSLNELRDARIPKSDHVIGVFLRASDVLADLVAAMRDEAATDDAAIEASLEEIVALIPKKPGAEKVDESYAPMSLDFGADEPPAFEPASLGGLDFAPEPVAEIAAPAGPTVWLLTFRPAPALYARGNEPLLLLRALAALGPCEIELDTDSLPALGELGPEDAGLTWRIRLETEAKEEEIFEIFEFVADDCALEAAPAERAPAEAAEAPGFDAPAFDAPAFEPAPEPVAAAEPAPAAPAPAKPAATKGEEGGKSAEGKGGDGSKASIRVDTDRIERLVNLAGELVITHAMLTQRIAEAGLARHAAIAEGLDELRMLTRDVQDSVMAIRAQPVRPLFQRMTRIVREAAHATGKSVRLVTDGEGTEVDKTIVERLADPLTHMIRNAVDHGIESSEKRAEAGKPAEGTIRLSAAQRSGRIVIEIADDGAGINRPRVLSIAKEKKLIPADAELSDSEIDNLLFMPGFSTAKEVSALSGRGVGMDVVKRAIQALGGRTIISSTPGQGSIFSISLPLTLAVLDGVVVRVADQTLVAPLAAIVETCRPSKADLKRMGPRDHVLLVRGEPLPIVDIGAELGFRPQVESPLESVLMVAETEGGARCALLVDDIFDQRQVVIKGLDEGFGRTRGVAAATILGDGRIALILDVDALVREATGPGGAGHVMALTG